MTEKKEKKAAPKREPKPASEFKIETGVPLPSRGRAPNPLWAELAAKMKKGDSVVVRTYSEVERLKTALTTLHGDETATARKLDNGFRVFRV